MIYSQTAYQIFFSEDVMISFIRKTASFKVYVQPPRSHPWPNARLSEERYSFQAGVKQARREVEE
jgi:hypothetical protein